MTFNHYVVIDGERYFVPEDGGIDAVRAEMLSAVRSGGAYVALGRGCVGYTEVMITPLTPIRIEHVTSDDSETPVATLGDYDSDPGGWQ